MSRAKKQRREAREAAGPRPVQQAAPSGQWIGLATLVGMVVVTGLSFASWRQLDRFNEDMDGRLEKIEGRISQLASKVDKMPAQAQPRRRGPDPNKVYKINTAGAPAKGPSNAAVTIAEFSDFQ